MPSLNKDKLATDVQDCTACEACLASCPTDSIYMSEDPEGFMRPYITESTCIGCKKCLRVCPALSSHPDKAPSIVLPKSYAGIHKDKDILLNSSSGGAFSALANEIFQLGGFVYGAGFGANAKIVHTKASSMHDLHALRGAKYAHSSAVNAYKQVKDNLTKGHHVLFTGTPCQIVGLRHFLGQKMATSDLLYTCDIICHGMMPSRLYREYIKYHEQSGNRVDKIFFRYKEKGSKGTRCKLVYENGDSVIIPNKKDYYHDALVSDFCLRKSCYNCQASQLPRAADFTIGDFWGIKEVLPYVDDTAGVSVIFFHSEKAKAIIKNLESNMHLWEVSFNLAVKNNPSFWYSPKCYSIRETFLDRLKTKGYKGSVLHYFGRSLWKRMFYNTVRETLKIFTLLKKWIKN